MDVKPESIFFYGLFMDEDLLKEQGIRVLDSAVGSVEGFRLAIGARATLLPEAGSRAFGVLMHLNPGDTQELYSSPGLADYVAEPVTVWLPGNRTAAAVCYNLPANKLKGRNREYATRLLALATRLGLPDTYLEHLRSLGAARQSSR
jgi:hypothetical protein